MWTSNPASAHDVLLNIYVLFKIFIHNTFMEVKKILSCNPKTKIISQLTIYLFKKHKNVVVGGCRLIFSWQPCPTESHDVMASERERAGVN